MSPVDPVVVGGRRRCRSPCMSLCVRSFLRHSRVGRRCRRRRHCCCCPSPAEPAAAAAAPARPTVRRRRGHEPPTLPRARDRVCGAAARRATPSAVQASATWRERSRTRARRGRKGEATRRSAMDGGCGTRAAAAVVVREAGAAMAGSAATSPFKARSCTRCRRRRAAAATARASAVDTTRTGRSAAGAVCRRACRAACTV